MTETDIFDENRGLCSWMTRLPHGLLHEGNGPENATILRVADQVCRNAFLFDLKQDLERTWEPVEFRREKD